MAAVNEDPYASLKKVVALIVISVWAITFLTVIVIPEHSDTPLLAVQAAAMLVLGGLYADRIRGRRGR